MRKAQVRRAGANQIVSVRRSALERLESRCVLSGSSYSMPVSFLPVDAGHSSLAMSDGFVADAHHAVADQSSGPWDPTSFENHFNALSISGKAPGSGEGINGSPAYDHDSFNDGFNPGNAVDTAPFAGDVYQSAPPQIVIADFGGYRLIIIETNVPVPATSPSDYSAIGMGGGLNSVNAHPNFGPPHEAPPGDTIAIGDPSHNSPTRGIDPSVAAYVHIAAIEPAVAVPANPPLFATARLSAGPASAASTLEIAATSRGASPLADRAATHTLQNSGSGEALPTQKDLEQTVDHAQLAQASQSVLGQHARFISAAAAPGATTHANLPLARAALVDLPFDLPGVERAVYTLMNEVETLGTKFSSWLDEAHLLPIAGAVSAVVLGGGAAYYVRRRGVKQPDRHDDEPSSSWLFLKMQPHPGE